MARHMSDSTMSLYDGGSMRSGMNYSTMSLTSINSSISVRDTDRKHDEFDRKEFVFCLTRKQMINNRKLMAAIQYLNPEYTIADTAEDLALFAEERRKYFFICDAFSGELFQLLRKKSCRICGPALLIYVHGKQRSVPDTTRPLFNGSMFGVAVCFTGFASKKDAASELANLVHFMGGSVRKDFSGKITHVVAHVAQGQKYKAAVNLGKNIVTEKWVTTAWENRLEENFKSTSPQFINQFQMKPFHGLKLSFLGFSVEETEHMQEVTVEHDGEFCPVGSTGCTHLVVEELCQPDILKGVHTVKQEWFWASIQLDACAEESLYCFVNEEGTPIGIGKKRSEKKRKHINAADISDLFSPASPIGNKRKSKDRLSTVSSTFDSTLNSPLTPSVFDSPDTKSSVPRKALTVRNQTCLELQQTERNYVDVIRTIIKVFKEPLEKSGMQRGGPLLAAEEIKTIFGALPDLIEVHERLLASLDVLLNNWHEEQLIGKAIVDCADGMIKAYPNFVNYFDMIKETIVNCDKEQPRFHAFLKICLNKPDCGRQTLAELLIRPVQRLPSMSLLLNDILKHTPESNPDHKYLKEAVESIKNVLTYVNEDRRKTENQFQMFEIIGGIDNCPPYILSAHRALVSKAEVQEVSEGLTVRGDHMHVMFLFNDSIEIAKRRNRLAGNQVPTKSPAIMHRGTQLKPYKHGEFIKLSLVKSVVDIKDEGDHKAMFGLIYYSNSANKDTLSVFKLIGGGAGNKEEWLSKIIKCLSETKCTADTENFLVSIDAFELVSDRNDISLQSKPGYLSKVIGKTKAGFSRKVARAFSLSKTPKLQPQANIKLRRAMSSTTPISALPTDFNTNHTPMTPGTPISPSLSEYSVMEMSVCEERK